MMSLQFISKFKFLYKYSKIRLLSILAIICIILLEINQFFFLYPRLPENYELLTDIEVVDSNDSRIDLYKVHGRAKFFLESEQDANLDYQYSQNNDENFSSPNSNQTIKTLYFLFESFFDYINNLDIRSTYGRNRGNKGLLYWLDYGTLLGSFRNDSIIPWDRNGDLGFMVKDLKLLPQSYETAEWMFLQNPNITTDLTVYDQHNTVAARVISKRNGVFINIMAYSFIRKLEQTKTAYVYSTCDFLDHEKWHKAGDLFPLSSTGVLGNLTNLNVPNNTKKWLLTYYIDLTPIKPFDWVDDNEWNDHYYYYMNYVQKEEEMKQLKQDIAKQSQEIERLKMWMISHLKVKPNFTNFTTGNQISEKTEENPPAPGHDNVTTS